MSFVILSCFLIFSLVSASEDQLNVKAGDDVTLQCQVSRDASVILLEWNRSDLKSEGYIFFFREKRSYNSNQLPSFRGRVELTDPEMKNGDVSVILKNVTVNDAGMYECRYVTSHSGHDETEQHRIRLTVTDSKSVGPDSAKPVDPDSGHTPEKVSAGENKNGQHAVIVTVVLLLSAFIGGVIFMNREKIKALLKRKKTYDPAGGEDAT